MATKPDNVTPLKQPPDNLALWNALSKTDPAHTKPFKRAGGFSGTAIKPMWIIRMLTEQFGPVGKGWGYSRPEFQLVPANNELLVFCTVEAWHGDRANVMYGVGGDKVVAVFQSGPKTDDEAFKKAFTDALGNAFKFVGAGADVHMGQFDDSKYRDEVAREFQEAKGSKGDDKMPDAKFAKIVSLIEATGTDRGWLCSNYRVENINQLNQQQFADAVLNMENVLAERARAATNAQAGDRWSK